MKIIFINTVVGSGSTGKITKILYELANNAGFESAIAYGRGSAPKGIRGYKIGNKLDFGMHVLINFFGGKSGFGSKRTTRKFIKWLEKEKPDIIHLHNLHGFYLNIDMLFKYIKENDIPIIWTLHDCWPMTGQCAYFDYVQCEKWKTGCFSCPVYRTDYPYSLFKDNSRNNYLNKTAIFSNVKNMTIVTPSMWLANLVEQSFLQDYRVCIIPNGIDLDIFQADKKMESTPKIVLGVANVWDRRKGLDIFVELSKMLDDEYMIVLIGVSKAQKQFLEKRNYKIKALTKTANQKELAEWYKKAYVYVNPTREDNFPTTNLEALACGTPVITFDTGGSGESIDSKCGIVVEKGNVDKLKEAIISLKNRDEITAAMCRRRAELYNQNVRFQEYIELYYEIGYRDER